MGGHGGAGTDEVNISDRRAAARRRKRRRDDDEEADVSSEDDEEGVTGGDTDWRERAVRARGEQRAAVAGKRSAEGWDGDERGVT